MRGSKFSDAQKAVHFEAGGGRDSGRGDLPSGGDQPGDLLQLERETRRTASDGDKAAEAA